MDSSYCAPLRRKVTLTLFEPRVHEESPEAWGRAVGTTASEFLQQAQSQAQQHFCYVAGLRNVEINQKIQSGCPPLKWQNFKGLYCFFFFPKCPTLTTKQFYRGTKRTCVMYEVCCRLIHAELPPRHPEPLSRDPVFLPCLLTICTRFLSKFLLSLSLQGKQLVSMFFF